MTDLTQEAILSTLESVNRRHRLYVRDPEFRSLLDALRPAHTPVNRAGEPLEPRPYVTPEITTTSMAEGEEAADDGEPDPTPDSA